MDKCVFFRGGMLRTPQLTKGLVLSSRAVLGGNGEDGAKPMTATTDEQRAARLEMTGREDRTTRRSIFLRRVAHNNNNDCAHVAANGPPARLPRKNDGFEAATRSTNTASKEVRRKTRPRNRQDDIPTLTLPHNCARIGAAMPQPMHTGRLVHMEQLR